MPLLIVLVILVAGGSRCEADQALAQAVMTDQVSITSGKGQLFGITATEGIARQFLASGEDILVMEAKGVTGFVHTSHRLLGLSGKLQRWADITLSSPEKIVQWWVTPRMVIVQGREAVYGFQSDAGRWKKESWGAGELFVESVVEDHIAVLVSNRRALGFSAFTGGFYSQDLLPGNSIQDMEVNDNVVILHLSGTTLVFRSGLAIWAELPN